MNGYVLLIIVIAVILLAITLPRAGAAVVGGAVAASAVSASTSAAAESSRSEEPTARSASATRFGYVTLVMKGDTYVPGALVLAQSIIDSGSTHDRICMVTGDVSESAVSALSRVFTHVRRVEYLNKATRYQTKRQRELYQSWLTSACTKWRLLEFTEYSKLLFMDADTMLVENIDKLFDLSAPAIVFANPWMQPWLPGGIKNPIGKLRHGDLITPAQTMAQLRCKCAGYMGGVVLLEPNEKYADELMRILNRHRVYPPPEHHSLCGTDEQAIAHTMASLGKSWTYIHPSYNWMAGKMNLLDADGPVPRVKHFYHEHPWSHKPGDWTEYETWYKVAEHLPAELYAWFPHAEFSKPTKEEISPTSPTPAQQPEHIQA